jgi:thymidylate synthase
MINKADKYLKETLLEILEEGTIDKNPRPKYADGEPAFSKFITQKVFEYNIQKNEFPINTLRSTFLKGAWYDIEAIYIKQTNVLEEMDKSIHSWWKDFIVKTFTPKELSERWLDWAYHFGSEKTYADKKPSDFQEHSLGNTYGHTIKRYDLMNELLRGLESNPFGRRHIIDMWQEEQFKDDEKALPPCAYSTLWSVRETYNSRHIDLTLIQRSNDFALCSSINPAQYVMQGMAVCNHLTFKTGITHKLGKFLHLIQNCHVYLRHFQGVNEILSREPTGLQPMIKLICEPKDFYSHTFEDFEFSGLENIKKLDSKLELAI